MLFKFVPSQLELTKLKSIEYCVYKVYSIGRRCISQITVKFPQLQDCTASIPVIDKRSNLKLDIGFGSQFLIHINNHVIRHLNL